jgi:hypothetical protein
MSTTYKSLQLAGMSQDYLQLKAVEVVMGLSARQHCSLDFCQKQITIADIVYIQ